MEVERGGYASDLLAWRSARLDSRDAGLAHELALGVLRYRLQLDFLIRHFAGRAIQLDPEVRVALELGVFQLRYLERVPAHAAVAESVDLVRRARKKSAAGLVNAILRKTNREPVRFPDASVALSHPAWMLERWQAVYGAEPSRRIAEANLQKPAPYLRVRPGQTPPPGVEPTGVAGCYLGQAEGYPQMDIGSQSIVPLLDLRPGQRFLDLCAAPGNKTAQALESEVRAVACDLSFRRLAPLRRLDIPLVHLDATQPLPFGPVFDRILVDAPCSGTGTLARNPEIKWKLTAADLIDLQGRQKRILLSAIRCLKPGGRLVYSTCSLEPEENERVVEPYQPRSTMLRLPGRDPGDGFFAAVIGG
jgi:16S rRNA (cytosine967-C5)-methyltransferase